MTHTSNVEWRKVLDNFRSAYQSMSPEDILIVELIANCLDAGANHLSLSTRSDDSRFTLQIDDDGKGMRSKEEFERYHDLGSLTKTRGGAIGWAGIGAKLYLDKCDQVYTETRSSTFAGASRWTFRAQDKAPHWDEVKPIGLVSSKTGTSVEVRPTGEVEPRSFSALNLQRLVLQNYNYALKPHGRAEAEINGEKVSPIDPEQNAKSIHEIDFELKTGETVTGKFFILDEAAPEGFELVSIVVHGKTIVDHYDFKQLARIKEIYRVSGYVRCDPLIQIVTTSKDSFNRKTPLWFEFNKQVGRRFASWLEKEGALSRLERDTDLDQLASELGKDLNRVFSLPEIKELGLDLFQLLNRRNATIPDGAGGLKGSKTEGVQITTGTVGGPDGGSGVPTEGEEPGIGVRLDSTGDLNVSERVRRTRGGIAIAYSKQPGRPERAWVDPGLRAIVINQANPAFQCADELAAIPYYTADCCFAVVTETIEAFEEREATVGKLFSSFLKVAQ
jgi:hypothetical protein